MTHPSDGRSPDKLWTDLARDAADETGRATSRDAMLSEVRAHRRRRSTVLVATGMIVPLAVCLAFGAFFRGSHDENLVESGPRRRSRVLVVEDLPRRPPPQIAVAALTDEELLASFHVPVALVERDGRSRLVFARSARPSQIQRNRKSPDS